MQVTGINLDAATGCGVEIVGGRTIDFHVMAISGYDRHYLVLAWSSLQGSKLLLLNSSM